MNFAKTADNATSSMLSEVSHGPLTGYKRTWYYRTYLSSIAMHKNWMVAPVKKNFKHVNDSAFWSEDVRILISLDRDFAMCNPILL